MKKQCLLVFMLLSMCSVFSQSDQGDDDYWEFSDSNNNVLRVYGITLEKGITSDDGFRITDTRELKDSYDQILNNYKIEVLKDTLNVYEVHRLCLGDNFDCSDLRVFKYSYYFKDKKPLKSSFNLLPRQSDISQKTIDSIHNNIDNFESLLIEGDVMTNLKNINIFIKKLEALALYGDLKSFLQLVEFNKHNNPEYSYAARKAVRVIMDVNYSNTKLNLTQSKLFEYLVFGKH